MQELLHCLAAECVDTYVTRRLYKLGVLFVLGAITNVAVAWGLAIWAPAQNEERIGNDVAIGYWRSHLASWPSRAVDCHGWSRHSRGSSEKWYYLCESGSTSFAIERAHGWPKPSLTGTHIISHLELAGMPNIDHIWPPKFLIKSRTEELRFLPLRPLWPGFVINTIVFAGLLWLPLAPRSVLRCIRTHRGRCWACGYDLRGSPAASKICPECGKRHR